MSNSDDVPFPTITDHHQEVATTQQHDLPIPIVDSMTLALDRLNSTGFRPMMVCPKRAALSPETVIVDDLPGKSGWQIVLTHYNDSYIGACKVLSLHLKTDVLPTDKAVILPLRFPPLYRHPIMFSPFNAHLIAVPHDRPLLPVSFEALGLRPVSIIGNGGSLGEGSSTVLRYTIPAGFHFDIVHKSAVNSSHYLLGLVSPDRKLPAARFIPIPAKKFVKSKSSNPFTDKKGHWEAFPNKRFAAGAAHGHPKSLPQWFHPLILIDPSSSHDSIAKDSLLFGSLLDMRVDVDINGTRRHMRVVDANKDRREFGKGMDYFFQALVPITTIKDVDQPDNPNIHPRMSKSKKEAVNATLPSSSWTHKAHSLLHFLLA